MKIKYLIGIALAVMAFIYSDVYFIPSNSMSNTILNGDVVLALKTRRAKRGQIICFRDPSERNVILLKRCVAIPGDTLLISNGEIFTNHSCLDQAPTVKQSTRIIFRDISKGIIMLDSMGVTDYHQKFTGNSVVANLSFNQRSELAISSYVSKMSINTERPDTAWMTYPKDSLFQWTIDNFGPVILPVEGMIMNLSEKDFILYRKQIAMETTIDSVSFRDKYRLSYTFNENYFFMMGDNRHESRDSRYFGFVPGNLIVGRAVMVLLSIDKNKTGAKKIRFKRFFKMIE